MELNSGNAWKRVQQTGLRSVSAIDLMVMVLSRQESDMDAVEKDARELIGRYGMSRMTELCVQDLHSAGGLEPFEASRLLAALELGRRISGTGKTEVDSIANPDDAYRLFRDLATESKEHFCVGFLDTKKQVIARKTIHIGTLNMSVVGPREIFREAVRENAASLVLAHNHPSGDPSPSPEDLAITKKLKDIGDQLDISVIDHIIVGSNDRYVSLHREGFL